MAKINKIEKAIRKLVEQAYNMGHGHHSVIVQSRPDEVKSVVASNEIEFEKTFGFRLCE